MTTGSYPQPRREGLSAITCFLLSEEQTRSRSLDPAPALALCLLDPDGLDVHKFADAEDAQLAPVAGVLDAAERQARIGGHHRIDENQPRFDLLDEALALGRVVRPRAAAETER